MTNEEKAKEIQAKLGYSAPYYGAMAMAHWKDEQHKQEKQQLIGKVWKFLDDLCDRNFLKKDDVFDRFKKAMEEKL